MIGEEGTIRVKYLVMIVGMMLGLAVGITILAPQREYATTPIPSVKSTNIKISFSPTPTPPAAFSLPPATFVSQSFNNCGPASLSMLLGMFGKSVSQEELAEKMRPFNNPYGGVDDKSVFPEEFVQMAKEYGFAGVHRANGSEELLTSLISQGFPVIVRTYLNPQEDIGHYRIVRGYDSTRGMFIQDDSYQGANIEYSFTDFETMWRPFNHEYIVIYPQDKEKVVAGILGDAMDETTSWQQALLFDQKELQKSPDDTIARFNEAVALYRVGKYHDAVASFEKVQNQLPDKTLWYQLEPFEAYLKTKEYDKLFSLTDSVLNNGDLANSELYYLRSKAYEAQGKTEEAKEELAKAYEYNKNFDQVKKALGI